MQTYSLEAGIAPLCTEPIYSCYNLTIVDPHLNQKFSVNFCIAFW